MRITNLVRSDLRGRGLATPTEAAGHQAGRLRPLRPPIGAALLMLLSLPACAPGGPKVHSLNGEAIGTTWSLKVVDEDRSSSEEQLRALVEEAIGQVDVAASTYRDDSEIAAIANLGPGDPIEISANLEAILDLARMVYDASDGAFDPTVGPLVAAYGFGAGASEEEPTTEELGRATQRLGFESFQWADSQLTRERTDVVLDLSGIAKGYAVDLAADALHAAGESRFMLEVGGEIRVSGTRVTETPWVLGIYEPVPERAIHGTLLAPEEPAGDVAVATSGDYRSTRTLDDGTRVSHVIDPRAGRALTNDVASVTITAPRCALADALATAVMVLGPTEGLALVDSIAGAEAYVLVHSGESFEARATQGFMEVTLWERE